MFHCFGHNAQLQILLEFGDVSIDNVPKGL
jgi:hypothetical protein